MGTHLGIMSGVVSSSGGGGTPGELPVDPAFLAPTISFPNGLDVYPPTPELLANVEWDTADNIFVEYQRASNRTFTADLESQVAGPITDTIYDAGEISFGTFFTSVSSGSAYYRARGRKTVGAVEYASAWSSIVKHGDTAVPILASSSTTAAERSPLSFQLVVSNKPVDALVFAKTGGGTHPDPYSISSTGLVTGTPDYEMSPIVDNAGAHAQTVEILAVDLDTGLSTTFAFTVNVTDIDEVPDAFMFTDVVGATASTVVTSPNTIAVAGLAPGVVVPVTVSGGEYRKNGGAWTTAPTTAVNGNTFDLRHTSAASYLTSVNTVLNIGGITDVFTSTTMGNPANFLTDTFSEATDTSATAHVPNTGGVYSYANANTATVVGGGAYVRGNSVTATTTVINAATPPSADYEVSADVLRDAAGTTSYGGLVIRRIDANNYIQAYYEDTSGQWWLQEVVAGVTGTAQTFTDTFPINIAKRLRLVASGNSVSLYLNGALVIGPYTTAITGVGKVGYRCRQNCRISNLNAL